MKNKTYMWILVTLLTVSCYHVAGTLSATDGYIEQEEDNDDGEFITNGTVAFPSGSRIHTDVINIGPWDMQSSSFKKIISPIGCRKIIATNVLIYGNNGSLVWELSGDGSGRGGGSLECSNGNFYLYRSSNGTFASSPIFSGNSNRGIITIQYIL